MGLEVRTDGYVKVSDLLKQNGLKVLNLDHLKQITADCAKQRFGMVEEEDGWYMRANQGHSMGGIEASELLTQITDPSEIPVCIHGTYMKYWDAIKETGLSKMNRQHIHMTTSEVQKEDARSGFRKSCNLLIFVDAERAMTDGCLFYRSENNVILSPGFDGAIPAQYFSKVITRHERKVIFPVESI
jgi:2'-phosphotransferase